MKKFLVICIAALLLVLCVPLSACAEKEAPREEKALLSGFESVEELLTIGHRYIGSVDLSEEHVTEGEKSARFELEGQYVGLNDWYAESTVQFMTGSQYLMKVDYKDVIAFEIDIYNDSGKEVRMLFSINANPMEERTLREGDNRITIGIDRRYIGFLMDMSAVSTFELTFEGRSAADPEWVLYLDNFRAVTTEKVLQEEEFDVSGNVLYDFDNIGEARWKMAVLGAVTSSFSSPVFSVNNDPHYIYTGTSSLRVQFRANRQNTGVDGVGFRTLTETVNYDWSQYDEDKTYLEWHIYNAAEHPINITVTVYSTKDEVYQKAYTVAAGSWGAYSDERALLSDINDAFTGEGLDIMSIGFLVSGTESGDVLYLDSIRFIGE